MKTFILLGAVLFAGAAFAANEPSQGQKKPGQSYLYQMGGDSSHTGSFTSLPKGSLTEAELLIRLDKEGRDKYRSFSQDSKKRVLEIASHSGAKAAVQQVVQELAQNQKTNQDRMLNNGMNRINPRN